MVRGATAEAESERAARRSKESRWAGASRHAVPATAPPPSLALARQQCVILSWVVCQHPRAREGFASVQVCELRGAAEGRAGRGRRLERDRQTRARQPPR